MFKWITEIIFSLKQVKLSFGNESWTYYSYIMAKNDLFVIR